MKNLKKVLALVLAFACAFTMFAGAAFTDSADIKVDTEVVDTLVSLGVVNGYDDGSFKPNGTVTRAEMAKMIYVLRTGNSDASAYNDDKTSFTDIGSHWARGYIKYCQSLGIIAGKSNTKFVPNEKVSAQEAAKMLLVTLGYDAQKAGLVGTGWASKTNALADENGLLEDVNTSFTSACPRQYAAQLIYNAIFAKTVVLRDGEYTDETAMGVANKTVGEKYMGMKEAVGELNTIKYDSDKDEYSYTIGVKTTTTTDGKTETTVKPQTYKTSKDYSKLYGLKVKVLYKTTSNKTTVYGLYAKDSSIVASGVLGDLKVVTSDANKIKIDGTEYKLSGATDAVSMIEAISGYDFDAKTTTGASKLTTKSGSKYELNSKIADKAYYSFDLLDTTDDDKGDKIVVYPVTVGKVTYAGTKSINVEGIVGSLKYEDEDIADGIKKDDYVVVVKKENNAKECFNVAKAEVVSGKVTATKSGSIQINNTWYDVAGGVEVKDFTVGDSYDVAVYNGYAFSSDATEEASKDILFVAGTKNFEAFAGEDNGTVDAKVYFLDGSSKTVTITKLNGDKLTENMKATAESETATAVEGLLVGKLFTYTVKDGNYEVKALNNDNNKAGYKTYATGTYASEKIADYAIASDAVVFVKAKNNDGKVETKVMTGKSVKDWKGSFGDAGQVLVSEINGIKYVKVAALVDDDAARPSASGDYKYAYLTDDVVKGQTKDADADDALVLHVFGENGAETLYDTEDFDKTAVAALEAGQVIKYTEDGSKIKDVAVAGTAVAITGVEDKNKGYVYYLDSTTNANGKSISKKLDEDVFFVKIDDANTTAEAGTRAEVVNAHSESKDKLSANAYIVVEDEKIVAVFYDVDKLDGAAEFVDKN